MFTAKGTGDAKLPNGLFQVTVAYIDDTTLKVVTTETYLITDPAALKLSVDKHLQQLKDAADDAAVQFDIVGKVLGTV